MKKQLATLSLFITVFVQWVTAANYYVDPVNGSDSYDGTVKVFTSGSTGPWKTIPGTRLTNDTGFVNSGVWGSFSTSARVPDNTTFKIKPGTIHSRTNGGYIWMGLASGHLYNGGYTNIVIEADQTWGTGDAILDGTDLGVYMLLMCQIDGVTFRDIRFQNSINEGAHIKEKAGTGAQVTNIVFDGCSFYNNATTNLTDFDGSGMGQLNIRHAANVLITNTEFIGNNRFVNGALLGDNHKYVSGTVIDCTFTGHQGDPVDNDAGIGVKALNGRITFKRVVSAFNLKGLDLGEQSGNDADYGSAVDILYKVIDCSSRSNTWGINFNGSADAYPGTIQWYAINNLITDNADNGINSYSAPHDFCIVHNVFDNNGQSPNGTPLYNGAHLTTTPGLTTDVAPITVKLFNNVFRNQKDDGGNDNTAIILNKYFHADNVYTLTSDYNSYEQTGANTTFCVWSAYYGGGSATFSFGANGPGHASGNWYSWYGASTTPPASGTGHYHSDVNSRGTGCDITTLAPLNTSFSPTNSCAGSLLSTQSWYIAEMGVDRNGAARSEWTVGAYEYPLVVPNTPRVHGGIRGLRGF